MVFQVRQMLVSFNDQCFSAIFLLGTSYLFVYFLLGVHKVKKMNDEWAIIVLFLSDERPPAYST